MLLIYPSINCYAFVYLQGLVTRILFFLASIIILAFVLFDWINSGVAVFSILAGLLFLLIRRWSADSPVQHSENQSYIAAFPAFLLALIRVNLYDRVRVVLCHECAFLLACSSCDYDKQTAPRSMGIRLVDGLLDCLPRVQILRFGLEAPA